MLATRLAGRLVVRSGRDDRLLGARLAGHGQSQEGTRLRRVLLRW
jgi:hypothetical protein